MTGGGIAAALFTPDWSYAAILGVCILLGLTAVGWNGLYLSEVARIAPKGEASRATGGALFVTFFGVVAAPPIFRAIVAITDDFGAGFIALTVLSGVSGLAILRGAKPNPRR